MQTSQCQSCTLHEVRDLDVQPQTANNMICGTGGSPTSLCFRLACGEDRPTAQHVCSSLSEESWRAHQLCRERGGFPRRCPAGLHPRGSQTGGFGGQVGEPEVSLIACQEKPFEMSGFAFSLQLSFDASQKQQKLARPRILLWVFGGQILRARQRAILVSVNVPMQGVHVQGREAGKLCGAQWRSAEDEGGWVTDSQRFANVCQWRVPIWMSQGDLRHWGTPIQAVACS